MQELLGLQLHLADALAGDAPALADLLQGLRGVLLQPVVDDVPAQLADALADLAERVADLAVALAGEVAVLGARALVLDALEVRDVAVLVDVAVEGEVGLRHRAALRPDGAARLLEVLADVGADPPDRVGGEAGAGVRVELLDRAHQADVAFLDQVVEADRPAALLAGDGDDEGQVVPDELLLRPHLALAGLEGERVLLVAGERRVVADGLEIRGELLELPASALDTGGLHSSLASPPSVQAAGSSGMPDSYVTAYYESGLFQSTTKAKYPS